MAQNDVVIKFGVQGDKEFQSSVKALNEQIRTLGTQFNTAVKEMANADDKQSALNNVIEAGESRVSALNKRVEEYNTLLEEQRTRAEEIQKLKEEAVKLYGEESDKVKDLSIQYNNQTAEISKTENAIAKYQGQIADTESKVKSAGNSMEETNGKVSLLGRIFGQTSDKVSMFGEVLKANLTSEAIIGGIKKIASAIQELATASSEYADEILTLSSQTRVSAETLQEFKYMEELIDVPLNTISSSLSRLIRSMEAARNGTEKQVEAFDKLGVSVLNADGSLRDNEEVFYELIEALGKVNNETEADAIAMDIFGKSAKDLNPLIDAGATALKEYAEQAHNAGYVMDSETLQANGRLDDSIQTLKKDFEALKNTIGSIFAPILTDIVEDINGVVNAFQKLGEKIQENIKLWAIWKEYQNELNGVSLDTNLFTNNPNKLGNATTGAEKIMQSFEDKVKQVAEEYNSPFNKLSRAIQEATSNVKAVETTTNNFGTTFKETVEEVKTPLEEITANIQTIETSLGEVNSLLNFDPKNTELLTQKEKLLAKQVEEVKRKLEELIKQEKQMTDNGVDENSEQFMNLRRQIIGAEQELEQLNMTAQVTSASLSGMEVSSSMVGAIGDLTGLMSGGLGGMTSYLTMGFSFLSLIEEISSEVAGITSFFEQIENSINGAIDTITPIVGIAGDVLTDMEQAMYGALPSRIDNYVVLDGRIIANSVNKFNNQRSVMFG